MRATEGDTVTAYNRQAVVEGVHTDVVRLRFCDTGTMDYFPKDDLPDA